MSPDEIIERLCRRYRVPHSFGMRLRPLIERAASRPAEARQRVMDMIVRSFVQESERERQRERERAKRRNQATPNAARVRAWAVEDRILRTVAAILHGWNPPKWIQHFGRDGA